MTANRVVVSVQGGPFAGVDARVTRRRAHKMLEFLALERVELSIALVSDDIIRGLNHDYRDIDKATDVLAFAMRDGAGPLVQGESGAEWLGDIVISVETTRKQAAQQNRTVLAELTMLLGHGLLHLLGYDHDTKAKEKVMFGKTHALEVAATTRRS